MNGWWDRWGVLLLCVGVFSILLVDLAGSVLFRKVDNGDATRERCVSDCRAVAEEDLDGYDRYCNRDGLTPEERKQMQCDDPSMRNLEERFRPLYKPGTEMRHAECLCIEYGHRGTGMDQVW